MARKQSARNRKKASGVVEIRPQPGPQTEFMTCPADIVFYGGSAGSGKSFAAILEPLRHVNNPKFAALLLRQSYSQIKKPGGLWSEAANVYPQLGASPRTADMEWRFPTGATIGFGYLSTENDKYKYQGTQIPLLIFDEVTHYTETSFFYMLSRNRSACGVRPYVRATCNPDADSWVATFIAWWLDEAGYIDKKKSGVIRWFIRLSGELKWADTKQELLDRYPDCDPKSFTFIRASLDDNQILMKADPGYLANLKALHPVDQARLLLGNWKIRDEAGKVFQRSWFPIVDLNEMLSHQHQRGGVYEEVRFWDLAATEAKLKGPEPCSTSGVRIRKIGDIFYIIDAASMMTSPGMTNTAITNIASQDGNLCKVRWEIEPGSSGLRDTYTLMQLLAGYDALGMSPQGDKVMRAKPLATAAFNKKVKLIRGDWNDRWLNSATSFPDAKAGRDDVDASAGAYAALAQLKGVYKENKATWSR